MTFSDREPGTNPARNISDDELSIDDLTDTVNPSELARIEMHLDTPSGNQLEALRQQKLNRDIRLAQAGITPVVDWNVNRAG